MNKPIQPIEDYYPGTVPNPAEPLPVTHSSGDPIRLVQELCECNQALLMRIANLELSLAKCQHALLSSQQPNVDSSSALEAGEDSRASLAIAHDVAAQQEHLITILAQQLEANLKRVADFEREAALNQQRYRDQSSRVVHLEQDIKTLHSRLQRQQYYSLQLKAALEKTVRHNQVDPIWLERVWSQLAKDGGFTAAPAAITSWSQNGSDSTFPTPSELESWLDNLAQEPSPWTASEVLFAEEESEPVEELSSELVVADAPIVQNQENAPVVDVAVPAPPVLPATKPQKALELPLATKQSCSFDLTETSSEASTSGKKSKPTLPDLPSFLKPRKQP